MKNCRECHLQLTDEEIKYYESRCEQCEQEWADDISDWRHGAKNEKFDKAYSAKAKITH